MDIAGAFHTLLWFIPYAGCIAAEMVSCQPLFPGKSHMDQLQV